MTAPSDRDRLEQILTGHMPVVELCPEGHVHSRGCSCGTDPLNFVEHLAKRLIAAGFVTLDRAAEIVESERASEIARLTGPECPDPLKVPLLGNWLGGIIVGAEVLRRELAALGGQA